MSKIKLSYAEFYITHVCNLTCTGCNRFNNYKFTGFERWTDLQDVYRRWSDELSIDVVSILGGEPLLNPEFMQWLQGVRQLWPASMLMVGTNGYRLNKINGLYEFANIYKNNFRINLGIHNKHKRNFVMGLVRDFLQGQLIYQFDKSNPYQQHILVTDANGVQIRVDYNWWFHQGALIALPGQMAFSLHQSDPEKSHAICHSKTCHHFMGGKLYKCGAVALFPEFDRQHKLIISDDDRKLMSSYRPLQIDDSFQAKQKFIGDLPNAIDQCKFCPEEYHGQQIFAEEKKIVFQRNRR